MLSMLRKCTMQGNCGYWGEYWPSRLERLGYGHKLQLLKGPVRCYLQRAQHQRVPRRQTMLAGRRREQRGNRA